MSSEKNLKRAEEILNQINEGFDEAPYVRDGYSYHDEVSKAFAAVLDEAEEKQKILSDALKEILETPTTDSFGKITDLSLWPRWAKRIASEALNKAGIE